MNFSSNLKELRKLNNFTAKDLSNRLGYSLNIVYDWEKGRCEPPYSVLVEICDIFNVSVGYLLGTEDDFGNIVQNTKKESSINKEDREMLELIKTISPYQREALMIYLKTLKEKA